MKRRTASDRMAECIIDMMHEYKRLNQIHKFNMLNARLKEKKKIRAIEER